MEFYRCIKEFGEIQPNQVVIKSHYHWQRPIIVADSVNKTIFLDYYSRNINLRNEEFFLPLTMKELNKIKPHLRKTLLIDYNISFNKDCLDKLPKYCCYECGKSTFGTNPIVIKNTVGKCNSCGKEKQHLHISEKFKIDIFKT